MVRRDTLPVLALVVAACGGERPMPPPPPEAAAQAVPAPAQAAAVPETLLRGIVRLGPSPMFRSCEGEPLTPVADSTSEHLVTAYHSVRATEDEGMYIEVRGYLAGGLAVLKEIERAMPPSLANCDQPPPDYQLRAFGLDPAWTVTVSNAAIDVSEGDSVRIGFPAVTPDDSAGFQRYQTATDAGGPHSLHLLVQRRACSLGRTGAYAAIQALVVLDGRVLSGCAGRGRQM
jgi:uncharacterized membrane protein